MISKEQELKIHSILGWEGRMISFSKSGYRKDNPENLAMFNANIICKGEEAYEKIWYGDLDLTLDCQKLISISSILEKEIFVLYEMDARFDNEESPNFLNHIASFDFRRENPIEINEKHNTYFKIIDGIPKRINA
jgi:hypothetical protein